MKSRRKRIVGIFSGYIIVSDMDGTLLNSKGKLSDENINAIKYLKFIQYGDKVLQIRRYIRIQYDIF